MAAKKKIADLVVKPKPKVVSHADRRNDTDLPMADDVVPEKKITTPEQIAEVFKLAREQYALSVEIALIQKELKEKSDLLEANITDTLPKAMEAASMEECPLDAGYKVVADTIIRASVPSPNNKKIPDAVERNERGIAYMDEVAPSLVETVVTTRFGRGEEADLKKMLVDNARRKKPLEMELTRTVNTGTLGAWVRARIEAGEPVDEEKINVQKLRVAKLVAPKKAKDKV